MQSRGLLIAALLAALLGGGVWYSNKLEKEKESKPPAEGSAKLIDLPEDQFQKLEIAKAGQAPVILQRTSGKWNVTAPIPTSADPEAVSSMVSTLSSFTTDKLVEEKAADLAPFGLTSPSLRVTITKTDGKTQKLLIGDETATSGGFYAKLDNDPRVFTIYSYNRASIDKSWKDVRDKRLLTFDNDKVSRVEVVAKNQTVEFGKNSVGEWQILKPAPYRADNLQVEEIVRKLKDAKMDVSAPEEEAAKSAGLFSAGTPVATAKVTDASGTQQLEIRKNKEDYFAKSTAVEGVYKVAKDLGEGLDKNVEDLRNRKLFDFGFNDPTRIDIRDGANSVSLAKSGEDWTRGGKKLDSPGVQSAIDKLRDLSSIKFLTTGFTEPVFEATVVSSGGKRTEKVLISKSGNSWIARRDGEPALYELDGKAVEELQQALAAIKEAASPAKK